MIKYINECVGCPPERGCLGSACPNRNIPVVFCDMCGEEIYCEDSRADIDKEYHMCRDCEPDDDNAEDEVEYAEASQPYNFKK